jgi:flagellar biosynthesis protein FliQ
MPYYRAPKSAHDPLIEVAQMAADTIMAIAGPLFWSVLGIGLLTSLFR